MNHLEAWINPGPIPQLFLIYLLAITCISLIQMFRLTIHMWSFRRRKESLNDEKSNIETFSKAALKGRLETEGTRETMNGSTVLFTADRVETRFVYLWEICYAKVRATKMLVFLTVIIAFCMAAWWGFNICNELKWEESAAVIVNEAIDLLIMMTLALFVSAIFYALSSCFESILNRRRRDWNYFKAMLKEDLSPNISHGTN
jgi:hypothetical protein